jgi:hypothetical protein
MVDEKKIRDRVIGGSDHEVVRRREGSGEVAAHERQRDELNEPGGFPRPSAARRERGRKDEGRAELVQPLGAQLQKG